MNFRGVFQYLPQDVTDGDVVFYDLIAKEKLGDSVSFLQKTYAKYGHMGVVHKTGTHIKIVHHTSHISSNELLSSVRVAILPRRKIAIDRLFLGVTEEIKKDFERELRTFLLSHDFTLGGGKTLSGIRRFLGWHRALKKDPKRLKEVSEAMCSGFVAGVIYEAAKRVEEKKGVSLSSIFAREVTDFTPRQLKRWDIWESVPLSNELKKRLDPEVVAVLEGLA